MGKNLPNEQRPEGTGPSGTDRFAFPSGKRGERGASSLWRHSLCLLMKYETYWVLKKLQKVTSLAILIREHIVPAVFLNNPSGARDIHEEEFESE